jgi:tetratricopeptide (TPR) repeat protein
VSHAECEQEVEAGWALLRAGNPRGAALRFREALGRHSEHRGALIGLAQSQLELGQVADAHETAAGLLRLAPNLATAHRLKAEALRLQRRSAPAEAAAREAVRLDPHEPVGYHILGLIHSGRGDRRSAAKVCREGLAQAPASTLLMAQLADNLLETEGAKAAAPWAEEALRLAPDNQYAQRVAARLALARNQLERSRDLLSAVLRRDPNNETAVSLYLLTDPNRYRILRAIFQFQVWRRTHGALGMAAGVLTVVAVIAVALALVALTKIPGIFFGVGLRLFLRSQNAAHRREVKAHFKSYALNAAY